MAKKPAPKKKAPAMTNTSKPKAKMAKPSTKPVNATPAAKSKSLMIVYGYDEERRARAAVFHEADFKLARKAAGLMGFKVFVGKAEKVQFALDGIKAGRVHATDTSFVPVVIVDRLEELIDTLSLPLPPLPKPPAHLPVSWDAIAVRHLVLGQADDPKAGYYEGTVEAIDGDMVTLKARDFPEVTVKRHRAAVALMYTPGYAPPQALADAAPGLPKDWESIAPDHLVLALLGPSQGWYEAVVTERDGRRVVLKWRDDPKLPKITRTLSEIALLYPKAP